MGEVLTDLAVMIAAVGFIVSSIFITGLGASFSREIVTYAGGNLYLLLMFGAASSFVLEMCIRDRVVACVYRIALQVRLF